MEFSLDPKLSESCIDLGNLRLSKVLLANNSHFPWVILVPRRAGATEAYKLSKDDQISLVLESNLVSRVLQQLFDPDKLNIATIGNIVPQLHMHHVARFEGDLAWPGTVWGSGHEKAYDEAELETRVTQLKEALKSYLQ